MISITIRMTMYRSTRSARLFCSRSTSVSTVREMRSSLRSTASRRPASSYSSSSREKSRLSPGSSQSTSGFSPSSTRPSFLWLREVRVADVAQQVAVLGGGPPAPFRPEGEGLHRVEEAARLAS